MCLLDEVTQWMNRTIVCVTNTHRDPANPLRRPRGACRPCMLSNTARKPRQCTEDCERGRRYDSSSGLSRRAARGTVTRNTIWIPFICRFAFTRRVCSAIAPTRFMNVLSRPATVLVAEGRIIIMERA